MNNAEITVDEPADIIPPDDDMIEKVRRASQRDKVLHEKRMRLHEKRMRSDARHRREYEAKRARERQQESEQFVEDVQWARAHFNDMQRDKTVHEERMRADAGYPREYEAKRARERQQERQQEWELCEAVRRSRGLFPRKVRRKVRRSHDALLRRARRTAARPRARRERRHVARTTSSADPGDCDGPSRSAWRGAER